MNFVELFLAQVVILKHARAGKIKLVGPAVTYNGRKMEVRMAPPWLSEHTEEVGDFFVVMTSWNDLLKVMGELGYSTEEIADLRKRAII